MSFPPQQSADTVTKSRKIPKSRVYCPNKQKPHKKRTLFPKASKKKSENALNKYHTHKAGGPDLSAEKLLAI